MDSGKIESYTGFFKKFQATVNCSDQLPVQIPNFNISKSELAGAILNWTFNYLNVWDCPTTLIPQISSVVLKEIKNDLSSPTINCDFNPDQREYDSLKLMQYVIRRVIEVCLRYAKEENVMSLVTIPNSPVSTYATKNKRRKMEDRHVVIDDLSTFFDFGHCEPMSYYAVFDGHHGYDAAVYGSSFLHQYLAESPYFPQHPKKALQEAFEKTDAHFLMKCERENLSSGTTAVCALLDHGNQMLHVAWVGDSEAAICDSGVVLPLVEPHKPDRENERKRVEEMGGVVLCWGHVWRVNGQLAVSRAIGNADYKPYVSCDPGIATIPLKGTEDFLILACDGLWDNMSPELAAETVYKHLKSTNGDYQTVSKTLANCSKEDGSEDNISVIVVFLRDIRDIINKNIDSVVMETSTSSSPSCPFPSPAVTVTGTAVDNGFHSDDDYGPETDIDRIHDTDIADTTTGAKDSAENGYKKIDERNGDDVNTSSEEEEEWNYIKGASKPTAENHSQKDIHSNLGLNGNGKEDDMDYSLNPDAVEFVPVSSPTLSRENSDVFGTPAFKPAGDDAAYLPLAPDTKKRLLNDEFVASSPKKGQEKPIDDLTIGFNDFEKDIAKRPSDVMPSMVSDVSAIASELNGNDTLYYTSTKAVYGDDTGRTCDFSRDSHSMENATSSDSEQFDASVDVRHKLDLNESFSERDVNAATPEMQQYDLMEEVKKRSDNFSLSWNMPGDDPLESSIFTCLRDPPQINILERRSSKAEANGDLPNSKETYDANDEYPTPQISEVNGFGVSDLQHTSLVPQNVATKKTPFDEDSDVGDSDVDANFVIRGDSDEHVEKTQVEGEICAEKSFTVLATNPFESDEKKSEESVDFGDANPKIVDLTAKDEVVDPYVDSVKQSSDGDACLAGNSTYDSCGLAKVEVVDPDLGSAKKTPNGDAYMSEDSTFVSFSSAKDEVIDCKGGSTKNASNDGAYLDESSTFDSFDPHSGYNSGGKNYASENESVNWKYPGSLHIASDSADNAIYDSFEHGSNYVENETRDKHPKLASCAEPMSTSFDAQGPYDHDCSHHEGGKHSASVEDFCTSVDKETPYIHDCDGHHQPSEQDTTPTSSSLVDKNENVIGEVEAQIVPEDEMTLKDDLEYLGDNYNAYNNSGLTESDLGGRSPSVEKQESLGGEKQELLGGEKPESERANSINDLLNSFDMASDAKEQDSVQNQEGTIMFSGFKCDGERIVESESVVVEKESDMKLKDVVCQSEGRDTTPAITYDSAVNDITADVEKSSGEKLAEKLAKDEEKINAGVIAAAGVSTALAVGAAAVATAETKKVIKKSPLAVKKPVPGEEKAKPAVKSSTPATSARPTSAASKKLVSATKSPAKSAAPNTKATAAPVRSSVPATKPAIKSAVATKTSAAVTKSTVASPKTSAVAESKPKLAEAAKARTKSPAVTKSKVQAAKPAAKTPNGDVTKTSTMAKKPATSATAKGTAEKTTPSSKPPVSLATRTCLAPKPASPAAKKTTNATAAKRPISATASKVTGPSSTAAKRTTTSVNASKLTNGKKPEAGSKDPVPIKKIPATNQTKTTVAAS